MKFFLSFLLLTLVITASEEQKSKENHEETSGKALNNAETLSQTVKGNTEFAINFFKHVTSVSARAKDSPAKNVVLSPLSISTSFCMLSLGARSKTHLEIWNGLSLNNTHLKNEEVHQAYSSLLQMLNEPKSSLQVNIGNAIFVVDTLTLLKKFEDDVKHLYHAEIRKTNFSQGAEKEINEYVKKKTEGKIEELVKDLAADTKMVLINHFLFKGKKRAVAVGADYHISMNTRVISAAQFSPAGLKNTSLI